MNEHQLKEFLDLEFNLNPYDKMRRNVVRDNRGRLLADGKWRNFCCKCGMPLIITHEWMATKENLTCNDCRPPIPTVSPLINAFAPHKHGHYSD